jgi:hypothetical protein
VSAFRGYVVEVDTGAEVDVAALARQVSAAS